MPYGLSEHRKGRHMVVGARERSEVRDEQLDIFECRLLVFLEIDAEPAGGEAAVALRLFRATNAVSSSASATVTRPTPRAVTSASTRLPRSSARRKIVRGWPCEVDVAPPRGRAASPVYDGGKPCNCCHIEK